MTSQRPPGPDGPNGADGGGPVVFRPGAVRVLAVGWWLLAAVLAVDLLWRGRPDAALLGVPLLVFSCALVHALFWFPAVVVDDHAVVLVNVLRRVRLPWRSLEDLDTRWALTVDAGERRWTSWAAPASGRRVRPVSRRETPWAEPGAEAIAGSRAPGSSAGEAAVLVGLRWQQWQDRAAGRPTAGRPTAGRPTEGRPTDGGHAGREDPAEPEVTWNVPVVAALVGTGAVALAAVLVTTAG